MATTVLETPSDRLTPGIRPHPGDPVWRAVRQAVLDRDEWTCQRCGTTLQPIKDPRTDLTAASACVDHIVPIIRGGWHTTENLQALCLACNTAKGNQVTDFRADMLLRAALVEQIELRGIDVDTPIRYTRRGGPARTAKLAINVTPDEKQWVEATFGTHRGLLDVVREIVTA